jgi:flavin-binding protein dodecin
VGHVYESIELSGSSASNVDDAIRQAIAKAWAALGSARSVTGTRSRRAQAQHVTWKRPILRPFARLKAAMA